MHGSLSHMAMVALPVTLKMQCLGLDLCMYYTLLTVRPDQRSSAAGKYLYRQSGRIEGTG